MLYWRDDIRGHATGATGRPRGPPLGPCAGRGDRDRPLGRRVVRQPVLRGALRKEPRRVDRRGFRTLRARAAESGARVRDRRGHLRRSKLGRRIPRRAWRRERGRGPRDQLAGLRRRRNRRRRRQPVLRRHGPATLAGRAPPGPCRRSDPAGHRRDARRRARRGSGHAHRDRRSSQADGRDDGRLPPHRPRRCRGRILRAGEVRARTRIADRHERAGRLAAARARVDERRRDPRRRRDTGRRTRPHPRRDHAGRRVAVAQLPHHAGAFAEVQSWG